MNPSKRNLYILTFVLFVVMLGYGIVIPIFPFYIENLGAGGTELGLLTASYAVMRLIFGPIWGSPRMTWVSSIRWSSTGAASM